MNGVWRQEARLFLKAPATLPLLLLLIGLMIFAGINGSTRVDTVQASVTQTLDDDQSAYAAKRARLAEFEDGRLSESEAAGVRYAHRSVLSRSSARPTTPPLAELGFLSAAQTQPTPDVLPIGIATRHTNPDTNLQNPTNRLDGPFDLAFILTWLIPLFVVLLSYDMLAQDREYGGSALLAAQAGKLSSVVIRRAGVRFMAIYIPTVIVIILFTLYSPHAPLKIAIPGLLILMIGLALMIGFWITLAVVINAKSRSGAAAGLSLLTIWVAVSLLAPAVISAGLQFAAPPPDRLQNVLELREIESDLNRRRDAVSEAYYASQPDNVPVKEGDEFEEYFVREYYPRVLAFDAAFTPLAAEREAARVAQSAALRKSSVLSPPLALKLLINDLSGGGPERRLVFLKSVDDYQAEWRAHFNDKLASMRPLTTQDYDSAPVFRPVSEAPATRYGRLSVFLLVLGLPLIIALYFAWRGLRRITP